LRILFVNPLGALGGSEQSLLDVMASLGSAEPTLERRLLSMADGELPAEARALGVEVTVLSMPRALASLGESKAERASRLTRAAELAGAALVTPSYLVAFRNAVRRARPDIVHTNGMKAHVAARLAVPELPRVVHLRDFASQRPLAKGVVATQGKRALFVTNSHAVKADLLGIAPSVRARVVHNAIDVSRFVAGPTDFIHLAELAGLPPPAPGTRVVGMVATYAWWKGHRTFLAAAARLRATCPIPLRFYVVGGPIYGSPGSEISRAELERLIRSAGLEGAVGLVPFQREVERAYRGLDVVVHASERPEPFGRVIVEAMASGRPVVVARAGGAVEVFSEGVSGLGFTPGDADACAAALRSLLENDSLRGRFGSAARVEAEARFSRERLGPELLDVYRELLG
jgi:glycosyltransferase involved in cell wall biosynthesis